MNKTWLVLRNEIITNVTRKSWLFAAIGVPLIGALLVFGISMLQGGSQAGASGSTSGSSGEVAVEGYVDLSGLIEMIPEDIEGRLVAYPDETSAREALDNGDIESYYVVPADYVQSGEFVYVDPDFDGIEFQGQSWIIRWTLLVNMLGGDAELAHNVWNPMDLTETTLASAPRRETDGEAAFLVPYATGMILYVVIIMSASLLRSGMGKEKKDRVMEIMLTSITPRHMLTGKVMALGILGLLHTAMWAGTGYVVLRLGGQTIDLAPTLELPLSIVAWAMVFFLLGYAVYATLLAGLGALTGPNVMGSSSADFVVIWPLAIPLFFLGFLINYPQSAMATGLSLFPLTAPIAMMTRLASGGVPWWQPALAAVLMLITAALIVRAVSRMFRAQLLLSGQPFSVKGYFMMLVGRA